MASVPLMSDQDIELGLLPDYDEAVQVENFTRKGNNYERFIKDCDDKSSSILNARVAVRLGFLRKVLGILAFQFAVTFVFCTALYFTPNVRLFVQKQAWVVLASAFSSFGLMIAMFFHARTFPLNYFLLGVWTVLQAITVGSVVTFYEAEVVIQAIFLTVLVVFGLFCYTLQSKRDFSQLYALLFSVSLVLLGETVLQITFMSPIFNFVVSAFGAMVFSVYLVYDIHSIMHLYSEEDYIIACISIYMDIIGLFLRILQILAELNRN